MSGRQIAVCAHYMCKTNQNKKINNQLIHRDYEGRDVIKLWKIINRNGFFPTVFWYLLCCFLVDFTKQIGFYICYCISQALLNMICTWSSFFFSLSLAFIPDAFPHFLLQYTHKSILKFTKAELLILWHLCYCANREVAVCVCGSNLASAPSGSA